MAGLLNQKRRGLRCELSYRNVPSLARSVDGLAIGTVRVIVQLPVKWVYLIGALPLDNTMRPQIRDQCQNYVQPLQLAHTVSLR